MIKVYTLFIAVLLLFDKSFAQTTDSLSRPDSIPLVVKDTAVTALIPQKRTIHAKKDSIPAVKRDSLHINREQSYINKKDFDFRYLLSGNPFFNFYGKPVATVTEIHQPESFELFFYVLLLILFYFAIIKLLFGKYLSNLFTLFFRVSIRQQQIREQVLQSPFPSLLLNILFVISGGFYATLLIRYYHPSTESRFWMLFLYFSLLLAVLYLIKFIILKTAGWIFNISRAVDTYLFIVFMTNKIIGIFLLPFLIILSLSSHLVSEIAITVSMIMIFILLGYRFIAAFTTLRKEIKMSVIHFFLYLCAFEVAPLLLIYKVLLSYLEKAY